MKFILMYGIRYMVSNFTSLFKWLTYCLNITYRIIRSYSVFTFILNSYVSFRAFCFTLMICLSFLVLLSYSFK